MMKLMKKVLSMGLVATMVAVMTTGCGNKNSDPESNSGKTDTNDNGTEETFVIGGLGPLTGDAAAYGISVKQGAEIAIKEINDAGGIQIGDKTIKLVLNFADDENSEETVVAAYNSLMDSGIDGLLGCVTSGACLAVIDQTSKDGILQITPSGSALDCTKYDNAFRLCFTDPLQGVTMANFIADELKLTKVAIIYDNSSDYSKGITDAFVEAAKDKGITIVENKSFKAGDVDFSAQLAAIKNTDAEVIFVPGYYTEAGYIVTQASDLGMNIPFVGSDGWDGILAQVTDPAVVEGAIFLSPFLATDPNVESFVTAYKTAYKSTPDQFAADGYDTVYVFKAAIEKAGSTSSADLIKAMTEIEVNGVTGKVTFTADGEPDKEAIFVQVKDGEYAGR